MKKQLLAAFTATTMLLLAAPALAHDGHSGRDHDRRGHKERIVKHHDRHHKPQLTVKCDDRGCRLGYGAKAEKKRHQHYRHHQYRHHKHHRRHYYRDWRKHRAWHRRQARKEQRREWRRLRREWRQWRYFTGG